MPLAIEREVEREKECVKFKGGSRTGAPGARPRFEKFYGFIFLNFDCITPYVLILVSIQCLHYEFYSPLLLQKHRVCVKTHKKTPDLRILQRWDRPPPPVFEIPGFVTEV